ncbi:bacteriocin-like protein [Chryseobacterium populi]|uniref:Uncharacterized protein n=1 Tax=Chryseobacterium populi TaxID=1144316 RepID=J2JN88_9FLAO|nr:hypothetical protein [Chryseobacterium populi]EJL69325.1 hypothetical protein PMI13_03292 [Chryseobacterium populi]
MKNLKKLSRNDLKSLTGGKLYPVDGCANMCTPRMGAGPADICAQYGLTCGWWMDSNGNSCNRCM